jgi:hypothetical protein
MQATGKAKIKPKEGLILPGQDPRGVEVSNVPTAFTIQAPGGIFGQMVGPGAINFPEPNVMFEYGVAVARGILTVGLGLAYPAMGMYHPHCHLQVTDLEFIPRALEIAKDTAGKFGGPPGVVNEPRDKYLDTFQKELFDKQTEKENKIRKELEARQKVEEAKKK